MEKWCILEKIINQSNHDIVFQNRETNLSGESQILKSQKSWKLKILNPLFYFKSSKMHFKSFKNMQNLCFQSFHKLTIKTRLGILHKSFRYIASTPQRSGRSTTPYVCLSLKFVFKNVVFSVHWWHVCSGRSINSKK